MSASESELLAQAGGGDIAALRTLLERHGPQARQRIEGKIGPQWRSVLSEDDVMQVTYLEAFLHIGRFAGRDSPSFIAWLARIAENTMRNAIKELGRKKRPNPALRVHGMSRQESCAAFLEFLGGVSTPSAHVARQEADRLIEGALNQLPRDYRTVVELMDLKGEPVAETAAAMGRSTGAVHMLRSRAHERLRQVLGAPARFFSDVE